MRTCSVKKTPAVDKNALLDYYQKMNEKYGTQVNVRTDDVEFALYTLSHHQLWDQLKELSEWAIVMYPDHYSGYYGLGEFFEKQKEYSQSLEYFQKGYDKIGPETLNKSDFYKDVERVKAKCHRD